MCDSTQLNNFHTKLVQSAPANAAGSKCHAMPCPKIKRDGILQPILENKFSHIKN